MSQDQFLRYAVDCDSVAHKNLALRRASDEIERLRAENERLRETPNSDPAPYIEDIRVRQEFGWAKALDGTEYWAPTSYKLLLKRNGEWSEVEVEYVNPTPPKG